MTCHAYRMRPAAALAGIAFPETEGAPLRVQLAPR